MKRRYAGLGIKTGVVCLSGRSLTRCPAKRCSSILYSTSKAAGFQMRFNWLVDIPRRIVIVRPAEGVFFGMRVQFRVM